MFLASEKRKFQNLPGLRPGPRWGAHSAPQTPSWIWWTPLKTSLRTPMHCMSSVQLLCARRCTFEHCTSCCPSRDATMVVLTKKKKKKKTPNAAYHCTKKIFWGSVPTSEARCSLKSAVWRRIKWVHQSANDKTTTWPPVAGSVWKSCFDQLVHDRSAVIIQRCAACHEFPRSFLVAAIIFPHTKWLKKITDYRDTPALSESLYINSLAVDQQDGPFASLWQCCCWLTGQSLYILVTVLLLTDRI